VTTQAIRAAAVRPAIRLQRDWREGYALRLQLSDLGVLCIVVFGVQFALFGFAPTGVLLRADGGTVSLSYMGISLALIASWYISLGAHDTRGFRTLGAGAPEYRTVLNASVLLFSIVACLAFFLQLDLARGYVLIAFPLGVLSLLVERLAWRRWLLRQRSNGRFSFHVLLVGSPSSATHIARELARTPAAGYHVVGAVLPNSETVGHLPGTDVPIAGDLNSILAAMHATGADTVVVTSADELPPQKVREISWSLAPGRQHLILAPSLTDIGGPRIHTRPVAGLPLVHVEMPRYEGRKLFTKRLFDVIASGALLAVLLPLLAVIAACVWLSSTGPVFFRQERVGLNSSRFRMLKFRSMVVDAETRLLDLQSVSRLQGNSVMFKMKNDPRITTIGRFLRRFSLDELPQLLNVFAGSMSLVGPRPPLRSEVELYDDHVHRRFLVKPGITGLWQVSGRSDLSWDESVRIDVRYVENWSLTFDFMILWKTIGAVARGPGAH
jgi:exopolysaccharide biosynthesis polyprenyl glycosylphosphotransferase